MLGDLADLSDGKQNLFFCQMIDLQSLRGGVILTFAKLFCKIVHIIWQKLHSQMSKMMVYYGAERILTIDFDKMQENAK